MIFCNFFKNLFSPKTVFKHGRKAVFVTLFGKTFRLISNKVTVSKKSLSDCVHSFKVPLFLSDYFYYFRKLPAFSFDYALHSDRYTSEKTAIVMQGPLMLDYRFTYETLAIYQKTILNNNPNVVLILSTWENEDAHEIECIKGLGVEVVQSPDVGFSWGNLNRQITSTMAGLKRANELGCKYVIKTRTDQRFYAPNIIEFLFNILKTFPLDKTAKCVKNRLVSLSFNSFKNRLYGVSDMFLFGALDDVTRYWNVPLNAYQPKPEDKTPFEDFKESCAETFVCRHFLQGLGEAVSDDIRHTYEMYAKYFCFVDKETVEMFWPKYSNMNSRWESFDNPALEEMKFRDWLNLYVRGGKNEDWAEKKYFDMPEI